MVDGQGVDSNMYLVLNATKEILLIDTGHDGHRRYLIDYIKEIGCEPEQIKNVVLTHVHVDHSGGLSWLVKKYKPLVNVCEIEAYAIEEGDLELTLAGMFKGFMDETHVDRQLKHGETFSWGEHDFEVIVTPGHTKGGICLYDKENKVLISGDTVFADGSFGRVDFPTGDAVELQRSLDFLATLDVEILLPGHMNAVVGGASNHIKTSAKFARMMI
nr:MBL fold metallo-hydrolase [Candidatus Sigynarchaeum springense]MDO8116715.1 MBL fold metallo-hydrolase [Candidatus Sigynarchaeota archaeon]